MNSVFSPMLFEKVPIVGIMRNIPQKQVEDIAVCYASAGFTNLEITMNSVGATETITDLVNAYKGRLNIGAGTVCTLNDLEAALTAGAQFIVTPVLVEEVIKECKSLHIPVFPGAYTPSEIYKAWMLGAYAVKVFPATKLGPGYFREVLAPLNQLKLMPTGGVTPENFTEFLNAGAIAVGMGSNLYPAQLTVNGKWDELKGFFTQVLDNYSNFQHEQQQHT